MIIPSFKELEEVIGSRYAMVNATAMRARKLVDGSEKLIKTKSFKPVSVALEEILEDKVEIIQYENSEEAIEDPAVTEEVAIEEDAEE